MFIERLLPAKHGSKHGDKVMKKIHVFMEYFFFLVEDTDKKQKNI